VLQLILVAFQIVDKALATMSSSSLPAGGGDSPEMARPGDLLDMTRAPPLGVAELTAEQLAAIDCLKVCAS
jgi:hypothetical protein